MKTSRILGCIWWCLCIVQAVSAWQLPLQEISDPSCKSLHWSDHDTSCKKVFELPTETVVSWPQNTIQKLFFSVLYESSYQTNDGRSGWHPGIDIVSAKGTPVVAIHDGIVTRSDVSNGYGNVVVIKHTEGEEVVYSNYAHLDIASVNKWDTVTAWQKIWEIGNTWFTIWPLGNHLDFQITTPLSPTHPYAYADCEAWYMKAVAHWLCSTNLHLATHNPFDFLHAKLHKEKEQTTPEIKTKAVPMPAYISPSPVSEMIHASDEYTIDITISPTHISSWRLSKIEILVNNTDGTPFSGVLTHPITIHTSNENLVSYTSKIHSITHGKKDILLHAKKKWTSQVEISTDSKLIKSVEIYIQ